MNRMLAWARRFGPSAVQLIRGTLGRRRSWIAVTVVVPLIAAAALFRVLFQRQLINDKLQRSEEQCRRADDNLLLAMATLGDRIDRLGLESHLLTKEELAFYKAIYDQPASEPAERYAIAMARRRAGAIHLKLNEPQEARLCFTLATHMLESLAVEKPEPLLAPKYRKILAEIYIDDAECQAASGDIAAAEASYDASLALLSDLLAKSWDKIDFMVDQAGVWQSRGAMYARLHRYPEAESDLQRALGIRLNRPNDPNESTSWLGSPASETIATWLRLSDVYRATHRSAEAIAVLQQALNAYVQLGRYQGDLHYREGYADALEKIAGVYADVQQNALSRDADRKALAAYESLESRYPEIRAYREKRVSVASRLSL